MKLSLAWIFDHIDADWKTIDVSQLVEVFNKTTAEIEKWHRTAIEVDSFSFARVVSVYDDYIELFSPEWKAKFELPLRPHVFTEQWYLVRIHADNYVWATTSDLDSDKEVVLPALYVDEPLYSGAWKEQIELYDYILEVDNKSITNRPDLWGHRGFAREIAAILSMPLKPLVTFITPKEILSFEQRAPVSDDNPFSTTVEDLLVCKRFASLYIPTINYRASLLWMAIRLSRTNNRSIDAVVDSANYVMLDMSQPMHTYDASKIENNSIIIRYAQPKEKLTILDGQTLTLTTEDLVIADGKKLIGLAGVMGGKNTGIAPQTTAIFLESACFDPVTVRWATLRHKIRTEASSRFEKSLDPNQNVDAIMRFLKLLDDAHITYTALGPIMSVGIRAQPVHIEIALHFINNRLGTSVEVDTVVHILEALAFTVECHATPDETIFDITVPTFRSSKDVRIKEDIVEEVGRFIGYDTIQPVLPSLELRPSDLHATFRLRNIKQLLSFGLSMREVQNYSFYDESFLRTIAWEPSQAVFVTDPASENFKRLVTSLVPHLLQSIEENVAHYKQLRFFEWARVWQKDRDDMTERKILAGVIFDQTGQVDFYDAKALLGRLFELLDCTVEWKQVTKVSFPWFVPFQTASLMYEGTSIGIAGVVDSLFLQRICPDGSAFIFELDGNFLLQFKPEHKQFKQIPKYPAVNRDMSIFIPLPLTVGTLQRLIKAVDNRIVTVELIDFFERAGWEHRRSVTFRLLIRDMHKTLTKEEVDLLWDKVAVLVKSQGATIR